MGAMPQTTNNSQKNLNHRSVEPGNCLVSMIASALLDKPELIQTKYVVLPTQRLQLYLTRELLLRQGGAGVLPRMMTWDQFIADVISDYFESNTVMVSSQAELVMERIIEDLIEREAPRKLNTNPSHAHELVHFHSELFRSGVREQAREELLKRFEHDWRRSPETLVSLRRRVDDVFNALDLFDNSLLSLNWTTPALSRYRAIHHWLTNPVLPDHLADSKIIIAGLTSLPKLELALLSSIGHLSNVEVWLDVPPPAVEFSPLASLRQAVDLPKGNAPEKIWGCGVKSLTSAADISHEAMHALNKAYSLIQEGIPPHEIAIIVPDEQVYGPALAAISRYFTAKSAEELNLKVTVNIPLAASWSTTLPANWIRLASEVGRHFDIHAVGQFLLHPVTRIVFTAGNFDFEYLQHKLKDFPGRETPHSNELKSFLAKTFNDPQLADYILRALTWCFPENSNKKHSFTSRVDELRTTLNSAALEQFKQLPRDRKSWEILDEALDQVLSLSPFIDYKDRAWPKFLNDLHQVAAGSVVRDTGEPLSGLQIIALTEARYIPLSHAILVGCIEGIFPHALPIDSLIDNAMRQSIGLPGWDELEALEDTTFHLLTCRIPNVHLSYALADNSLPLIRSRWIERLASRLKVAPANLSASQRWLGCEVNQPTAKPSQEIPLEGLVNDYVPLTSSASASRLRNLLWCPYRYLLEAHGISSVDLPEDRVQINVGKLLHNVLEQFFAAKPPPGLNPKLDLSMSPQSSRDFATWAEERLHALASILVPVSLQRSEDFQQMTAKGWGDVANFWSQLVDAGFSLKTVETEVALGSDSSVVFIVADQPISVKGSIDAVHKTHDMAILVDYKTSTVPTKKLLSEGLEPQLPLYAKVFSNFKSYTGEKSSISSENIATVYFNLKEGKATFAAVGSNIKPLLQASGLLPRNMKPLELVETITAVESRWTSRLKALQETKRFEADPSDCGFCKFAGICRKEDPRYRDHISGQAKAGAS